MKHAALLYDSIFPVTFEAVQHRVDSVVTSREASNHIFETIPFGVHHEISGIIGKIMSDPDEFGVAGLHFANYFKIQMLVLHELARKLSRNEHKGKIDILNKNELKKMGFEPILVMPEYFISDTNDTSEDLSVAIKGANLIDTTNADWEQILEVR